MVTYELIHRFKTVSKQLIIQKSHRFVFLNILRFILSPFGLLYGFILSIRNQCFNWGVFKSYHSSIFTIGIGNLSVGGTGKTPFTAYLINDLVNAGKEIAVVSRGYGRLSKGLKEVNNRSNASEVGDEPLLLKQRYPNVHVWVAEKREWGVKAAEDRGVDVILLDDNFQHRSVLVDVQFMLSKYGNPFFKDYPLPMGRLREFRKGAKRADFIVYTNTPEDYQGSINHYRQKTKTYSNADVRFASHQNLATQWALQSAEPKKGPSCVRNSKSKRVLKRMQSKLGNYYSAYIQRS